MKSPHRENESAPWEKDFEKDSPPKDPPQNVPNAPESTGLRAQSLQGKITTAARDLWHRYGCPTGRDEEIWLEAERQVLGTDQQVSTVDGESVSAEDMDEAISGSLKKTPAGRTSSPDDAERPKTEEPKGGRSKRKTS